MPSNLRRQVVEVYKTDNLEFQIHNTGLVYGFSPDPKGRYSLHLSNGHELQKVGLLFAFLNLVGSDDVTRVRNAFDTGITLDYRKSLLPLIKAIFASSLVNEAKLAYLISVITRKPKITPETLSEIMRVRPNPLDDFIELSENHNPNLLDESARFRIATSNAIYPDFKPLPKDLSLDNDTEFRRYCLTVAFSNSTEQARYRDFLEHHKNNFFISSCSGDSKLQNYRKINLSYIEDLTWPELSRFFNFYNLQIVQELRGWARQRADEKIVTVREKAFTADTYFSRYKSSIQWRYVFMHLTQDEADALSKYLQTNPPVFRSVAPEAASILAFYWAEASRARFEEFLVHVAANSLKDSNGVLQLTWTNPYSHKSRKRPDLLPYVKAVIDPELQAMPLEWALAAA